MFNLSNPALPQRPIGWTSSDAAGLPIVPGLVTVAEIKAGVINHAIRFTTQPTVNAYAYPASHRAGCEYREVVVSWCFFPFFRRLYEGERGYTLCPCR